MALSTVRAHRAFMYVVRSMAGDTILCRLAILDAGRMALGAVRLGMCAGQRKVRGLVIEGFAVQPDDIEGSAFVIRVAGLAFHSGDGRRPSMETDTGLDVGIDVLVAGQAQRVLRLLAERRVALVAIAFELGVGRRQWARHDKALQILSLGGA